MWGVDSSWMGRDSSEAVGCSSPGPPPVSARERFGPFPPKAHRWPPCTTTPRHPRALREVARWWQCDLRDKHAVDELFEAVARDLGGFDVLVHCAGLWSPSKPDDVDEEDLDFLFSTNLKATVFTNQAAFRNLRRNRRRDRERWFV